MLRVSLSVNAMFIDNFNYRHNICVVLLYSRHCYTNRTTMRNQVPISNDAIYSIFLFGSPFFKKPISPFSIKRTRKLTHFLIVNVS